jgi:hypothetical protein
MGYSYRVEAGATLNAVFAVTKNDAGSNVYFKNGKKYFFEHGKEQEDGSITGTVYLFLDGGFAKKVGSVKIDKEGNIIRWAHCPVKWKNFTDRFNEVKQKVFGDGSFAIIENTPEQKEYDELLPIWFSLNS